MKKIIALLIAAGIAIPAMAVEIKKICHSVMVKGKPVQQCKMVKIHKMYQGTKIPPIPNKK